MVLFEEGGKKSIHSWVTNTKSGGPRNVMLMTTTEPILGKTKCEKSRPALVCRYNQSMNGTDRVDQLIQTKTTKIKSRRWTMPIVCYMLDTARVNARTIDQVKNERKVKDTRQFAKDLIRELATPHIMRRMKKPGLQNSIKTKVYAYLGTDEEQFLKKRAIEEGVMDTPLSRPTAPKRTKRCHICITTALSHKQSLNHKKVATFCLHCKEIACLSHLMLSCELCYTEENRKRAARPKHIRTRRRLVDQNQQPQVQPVIQHQQQPVYQQQAVYQLYQEQPHYQQQAEVQYQEFQEQPEPEYPLQPRYLYQEQPEHQLQPEHQQHIDLRPQDQYMQLAQPQQEVWQIAQSSHVSRPLIASQSRQPVHQPVSNLQVQRPAPRPLPQIQQQPGFQPLPAQQVQQGWFTPQHRLPAYKPGPAYRPVSNLQFQRPAPRPLSQFQQQPGFQPLPAQQVQQPCSTPRRQRPTPTFFPLSAPPHVQQPVSRPMSTLTKPRFKPFHHPDPLSQHEVSSLGCVPIPSSPHVSQDTSESCLSGLYSFSPSHSPNSPSPKGSLPSTSNSLHSPRSSLASSRSSLPDLSTISSNRLVLPDNRYDAAQVMKNFF